MATVSEILTGRSEVSFDIETNGVDYWLPDFKVVGISMSNGDATEYWTTNLHDVITPIWAFPGLIIGHNIKFDLQCSKKFFGLEGYPLQPTDTMIAMNLLDENISPHDLGLKRLAKSVLGHEMIEYDEAIVHGVDSVFFREYAKDDARQTFALWQVLKPRLEAENLMKLLLRILSPMTKTVADMELYGFRWDASVAIDLARAYAEKRAELEEEIFKELGPKGLIPGKKGDLVKINLKSGDQLATLLFETLKIPADGVEMTKSKKRLSVDTKTIDVLAPRFPICRKISDMNHAADMLSKYILKISKFALTDPDSRTHASTWLVSATGRTRQTDPPNQTIPNETRFYVKTPEGKKVFDRWVIRKGFRVEPGRKLMKFDVSQFQLRLCAHISSDPMMLKAYRTWRCTACNMTGESNILLLACPHCGVAANEKALKDPTFKGFWHGLDLHQMTMDTVNNFLGVPVLDSRQDGKTCNFALIFKATAYKMHFEYPKYSVKQWQNIIDGFFATYRGVDMYHRNIEAVLKSKGEVKDIFGRRRRIRPQDMAMSFKHALNQAINFPVQSSEVGYMELACPEVERRLREAGMWADGRYFNKHGCGIVQFMHDEFDIDAPESIVDTVRDIGLDVLRTRVTLRVPIDAECKVKDAWA
jgi:DNA polymerase-1